MFRTTVTAATLCVLGSCSNAPLGGGALQVTVRLEPGVKSVCVKVTASDGDETRDTRNMRVEAGDDELVVGVVSNGLASPITVRALGFSDENCLMPTPGETSEVEMGAFTYPISKVTLVLRPDSSSTLDGGNDAGVSDSGIPDAGTPDASVDDSGIPDAGPVDSGQPDSGNPDSGIPDAGTPDSGTPDAGTPDAGPIDQDMDTFFPPFDCNDNNPNIHPGATESCSNRLDDDCDMLVDCEESACANQPCFGGGSCSGFMCVQPAETMCSDGLDNDMDGLIDCRDPTCVGLTCDDSNGCTTGDTCALDGGCEKMGDFACINPPSPTVCFDPIGMCLPDAGTLCAYTPNTNFCTDGLACTTGDSCSGGVCMGSTLTTCTSPPMCRGSGACAEPSGVCDYPPLAAGTGVCTDSNNCTVSDTCDGDGGCRGTAVTCTPSQCQTTNGCNAGGTCLFNPRTGLSCDAGTGQPATCDGNAACNVTPPLFPYTPSNFTEAQLPSSGSAMTIGCDVTLDTSSTPSVSANSCSVSMPPFTLITPTSGQSTVLIRLTSLTMNSGTLTLTGNRPVIFAVTGGITLNGGSRILARNTNAPAECGNGGNGTTAGSGSGRSGGGGGGFGSAGGTGGTSGGGGAGAAGGTNGASAALIPLRGGCNGGNGTYPGGNGGGSVQLTSASALVLNGTVTAPGRGGPAGNGAGEGGAAGGSGGAVLLEAVSLTINSSGVIAANGGGGGEGGSLFNGEDGEDGTATQNGAQGGEDGNVFGGSGGDGAALNTTAGNGQNVGNDVGAGGAGGGFGKIRVNAHGICSSAGTYSPAPSFTGCP